MAREKREYPPLLAPGFWEVTLDDLERLFVEPFDPPWVRRKLLSRFRDLVSVIRETGLTCDLWIDGSFLTEKPEPSDIDVVILSDDASRSRLTVSRASQLDRLIKKKDLTRYRYLCDLSYCGKDELEPREKWQDLFGRARNEEKKGIALLRLGP